MKRFLTVFCLMILILSVSQDTFAALGNLKFSKSRETTAEDIPLDFNLEKTSYSNGYLRIWGSVRNKMNGVPYRFVKVTFSLWGGHSGKLITREFTFTSPMHIGPGQIGYIHEYMIECDASQLNLVEYKVTGK
jgi:hypothetical protein